MPSLLGEGESAGTDQPADEEADPLLTDLQKRPGSGPGHSAQVEPDGPTELCQPQPIWGSVKVNGEAVLVWVRVTGEVSAHRACCT